MFCGVWAAQTHWPNPMPKWQEAQELVPLMLLLVGGADGLADLLLSQKELDIQMEA